jgi:hypothetical protein
MAEQTLSEQEMIDILEEIAREGGSTARIQAIKLLREISDGEPLPQQGFDELDAARKRKLAA